MKTVNLHAAKTHLSRLVDDAVAGQVVVIAKAGKPMVRLVPVAPGSAPTAAASTSARTSMLRCRRRPCARSA
jgi:prevent-host-death family protein